MYESSQFFIFIMFLFLICEKTSTVGALALHSKRPSSIRVKLHKLFSKSQVGGSKGFGPTVRKSSTTHPTSPQKNVEKWHVLRNSTLENELRRLDINSTFDIRNYLNPELFKDPSTLQSISNDLRSGKVVVLRNAFQDSFAESVYCEINSTSVPWTQNEAYFPDGFAFKHSNVYDHSVWTETMNRTFSVFSSNSTKSFIESLTNRDCSGVCTGSPSFYQPGDHSLPHTDWAGQRTVAYVWHLSKNWKPEWGGALYWAQNPYANATYAASFNTLVLFGVSTKSAHFVTTVSPHCGTNKRLAFNGWWQSSWVPRLDDVEEKLTTKENRSGVTEFQLQTLTDLLSDKWAKMSPEKRDRLITLKNLIYAEFYP